MSRVLVMGLGRFGGGAAAARWFAERGDTVTVTDLRSRDVLAEAAAEMDAAGVELQLGGHDPADFDRADVLVVNPAIPFDNALVRRARTAGASVVTEIGLTLRRLPGPWIGVTGTNGKSTTSAFAAAMLEESGVPVALGGNMGRPLLNECARLAPGTVAVLELSSFQLAWLEHDAWTPAAAVVTNVTGDHFDRHPDFEHYAAAKRRLVEAVAPEGTAVLCAGDPVCRDFARVVRGRVAWFGPGHAPPCPLGGLRLAGRHNRENAVAAALAALATGATAEGCARGAARLEPLPHRLQTLAESGGVRWVDDAVSTTPVATAAAVEACGDSVILLTGGRDKGLRLDPLLDAARSAREVVAYGETGPRLCEALPRAHLCAGLDAAVRRARELARAGDTILLSPGFASYDEFPGFDARGARFRELAEGAL